MTGVLARRVLAGATSGNAAIEAAGGLYVAARDADPGAVRAAVEQDGVRALEVQAKDLGFLEGLALEFLSLNVTNPDATPLATLPALRGLSLDSWVGDLDLRRLPHLQWLSVTEIEREQFEALAAAGHERLRSLSVGRYPARDLRPLVSFPVLTELAVVDSYHLADLAGLADLPRLGALELAVCRRLASLDGIAGAGRLRRLEVDSCAKVTDLAPLAGVAELTRLDVDARRPPSTAALAGHPSLAYLRLTGATVGQEDVTALLGGAGALRFLQVRRAAWWREGGGWHRVPNVYAMAPDEAARYDAWLAQIETLHAG